MTQRGLNFEATLLYREPYVPSASKLAQSVKPIMQSHGEDVVTIERIDDSFTLVRGTKTQVLINYSDQPLPLDPLSRKGSEKDDKNLILDVLTHSRGSTTILVLDREPTEAEEDKMPPNAKRSICWELIAAHNVLKPAALTFWAETESLYSAEEFDCIHLKGEMPIFNESDSSACPEMAADTPNGREFLNSDPQLSDECLLMLDSMLPPTGACKEHIEPPVQPSPLEMLLTVKHPVSSRGDASAPITAPEHSKLMAASMASAAFVLSSTQPLGLIM